jgi:LysM repeat protein
VERPADTAQQRLMRWTAAGAVGVLIAGASHLYAGHPVPAAQPSPSTVPGGIPTGLPSTLPSSTAAARPAPTAAPPRTTAPPSGPGPAAGQAPDSGAAGTGAASPQATLPIAVVLYTARPNDTLASIAQLFGTDTATLQQLNPALAFGLRPGDPVRVRLPVAPP